MIKMQKIFFLIVVLIFFLSSHFAQIVFDDPPLQQVYLDNLAAIPPNSYTKILPSWVIKQKPTIDQPFYYGFFKFTNLHPSISSRTTINLLGEVFWIWGEDHPNYYKVELTPDECGVPYYSYTAISKPWLEGVLAVQIENKTKTYPVYVELEGKNTTLKNPFKIDFKKEELSHLATKKGEKNNPILPKLSISFSGKISVRYYVFVMEYILIRDPSGSVSCKASSYSFVKVYHYPVFDQVHYDIEHSDPSFFLIQPLDKEQLTIEPQSKAVFLTNFNANKILISSNNFSSHVKFANYLVQMDEFGFKNILRQEFSKPLSIGKIKANSTFLFLNSSYFLEKTYNFAHQYYVESFLPYSIGRRFFNFIIVDDFYQSTKFEHPLYFKAGVGIYQLNSSSVAVLTDQNVSIPTINKEGFILSSNPSFSHRPAFFLFYYQQKISSLFIYLPVFILILSGLRLAFINLEH